MGDLGPVSNTRAPEILRGTLDMMVLHMLCGGPSHGYGIARRIQATSNDVLRIEEGSLYPALHRMEKRELVAATWDTTDTGRRAKFYTITRKGRARLRRYTHDWDVASAAVRRVLRAQGGHA